MKFRIPVVLCLTAAVCLSAAGADSSTHPKERPVMNASGHFDVKLEPQKADNPHAQAANLLRMSIYKQFSGAIEGTSNGEMLATRDAQDSGAYVAIEKITGSLLGRRGSFVLRHSGEMSRGVVQNWLVAVVPDSGTEQLQGLTGTMKIAVDEGRHSYDFTYTLPEP